MGLFSGISGLFGGGGNSNSEIREAASIQSDAANKGIGYIDPWYQAGLSALEQQQAGATPEGMDAMLARIFDTEGFQALRDERMQGVEGMLGAGGLTRSGSALEEAARVPTDLGFSIEQMLYGRNDQTTRQGLASAFSIGDLLSRSAEATASGILGVEQSKNQRRGSENAMFGDLLGSGMMAAGAYFSDPSLKRNIEKVDTIGPLGVYRWDWIPEAKGTIVEQAPTQGFLSTEVREHYPQFVSEFGGYDVIDYNGLTAELNHAID